MDTNLICFDKICYIVLEGVHLVYCHAPVIQQAQYELEAANVPLSSFVQPLQQLQPLCCCSPSMLLLRAALQCLDFCLRLFHLQK